MSNDNIISWNATNWITVTIMAVTVFFAFGLVQKYMQQKVAAPDAS